MLRVFFSAATAGKNRAHRHTQHFQWADQIKTTASTVAHRIISKPSGGLNAISSDSHLPAAAVRRAFCTLPHAASVTPFIVPLSTEIRPRQPTPRRKTSWRFRSRHSVPVTHNSISEHSHSRAHTHTTRTNGINGGK